MRISDWSSDVCSSDLEDVEHGSDPAVGRGRGRDGLTRSNLLQAFDDDLLALLEALGDDDIGTLRAAWTDPALLGLAVAVDDEHVRAGLIDDDCRLRDHQRLLRLCPLDDHADQLTGYEQPPRRGTGRLE